MSLKELDVDLEALIIHAEKLSDAVEVYKDFGTKPFDDNVEDLEKMNTDFVAKLKVMVENLNSGNKKIINALERIVQNTNKLVSNFQDVDAGSIQSMKGVSGNGHGD